MGTIRPGVSVVARYRRNPVVMRPMRKALLAVALAVMYVLVCVAPLAFVFVGPLPPRQPFAAELSVVFGFLGLSLMGLQMVLVGRFTWLAVPFGFDVLQRFHRQVSFVALAFVLAHPILLFVDDARQYLPLLVIPTAPWRSRLAVASVTLLLVLIALSVWRRRLRIPYEVWQLTHNLLAIAVMLTAIAHIDGVGLYTHGPVRRVLFDAMAGSFVVLLLWTRLIRPMTHLLRPWRVAEVWHERGAAVTLLLQPVGHAGVTFTPGQFVWLSRWPFMLGQHPYSISCPDGVEMEGHLSITIKSLGAGSEGMSHVSVGRWLYLDGPHGSFCVDAHPAHGYVFVAAGVGVTPIFSMLSSMCLREDMRHVTLIYASRDWDSVIFRDELEELQLYMPNLTVVHVLRDAPPEWEGERGRITLGVLARHLPSRLHQQMEYLVCGSAELMDEMERGLTTLGVPPEQIHTERFAEV
jgi:predicted ferric reductase